MQLLQEMIELRAAQTLNEEVELLLEYLGTLTVIDKNLIKSLKNVNRFYGDKRDRKLAPAIGAKSKVEKKIATGRNSDQLWKEFHETPEIVAIVLSYDGAQVMAISDRARLGAGDTAQTATMFTLTTDAFYTKVMPDDKFNETFGKATYQNDGKTIYDNKARTLKQGDTQAKSFIRKILDTMVKQARAEKVEVEVFYIYKDVDRSKTKSDRAVAGAGRIPVPADNAKQIKTSRHGTTGMYTKFVNDAKEELKRRLDKYKTTKAKTFTTAAEMLKYIQQEGHLDKLKIGDVDYEMKHTRMYFDDLLKKARGEKLTSWYNESYVEYGLRSSNWKRAKPIQARIMDENPGKTAEELEDVIKAAFAAELPPAKLKVMYTMKGGNIIASEVKALGEYEDVMQDTAEFDRMAVAHAFGIKI